jgi:GNAT superfamily N-acetyltransferase
MASARRACVCGRPGSGGHLDRTGVRGKATDAFDQYLRAGLRTEGHRVMNIVQDAGGETVATAWSAALGDTGGTRGGVLRLRVYDRFRRQGFDAAALKQTEDKLGKAGADTIRLHVFGHNGPARSL